MPGLVTPLCRQLGISYPIFSAGIAASAGPELAAAVSGAGGFGVLGGGPADEMSPRVARLRELTSQPFGLNVIIAAFDDGSGSDEEDRDEVRRRISTAIGERVPVLVLFWGDPWPFVGPAHEQGVKVFVQTGSVEEAERAVAGGVDAVIAQGVEAGGHVRAKESLWSTLPKVVAAVRPVPVIASGGIGDGAAIARALSLGAQGVSMGTRFVASNEAWTDERYKQRIVASRADDTLLVPDLFDVWWPNAPHRVVRNRIVREWEAAGRPGPGQRPGEGETIGHNQTPGGEFYEWPRYAAGMIPPDFDGDPDEAPMWGGLSVESVNDIKPAAAIVRDLVAEAEAALSRSEVDATQHRDPSESS